MRCPLEDNRRRDTQGDRIQSSRWRDLALNWPYRQGFQLRKAGEPAVVTFDTTAAPRLVAPSCMNNTLLRESIWWVLYNT